MSTANPPNFPSQVVRLPHAADVSAGERFESLARQAGAQAVDPSLSGSVRLQFLREQDRFETLSALADMDAILAAHAEEIA